MMVVATARIAALARCFVFRRTCVLMHYGITLHFSLNNGSVLDTFALRVSLLVRDLDVHLIHGLWSPNASLSPDGISICSSVFVQHTDRQATLRYGVRSSSSHIALLGLGSSLLWGSVRQCRQGSVLFFSCPRSEGWPHYGRTFSIYPCPLLF